MTNTSLLTEINRRVQPTQGVKQGCPLSPLLFSIYVNDIGCSTNGETAVGAVTGLPNFHVAHMLYADDLALTENNHTHMQAMLNKLQGYATRKYLKVNTKKSEVVCFNSRTDSLPPLFPFSLIDVGRVPLPT
eukprot:1138191-Pelagomonas_calceolata.AAC.4